MAWPLVVSSSVVPSGADFATASAPILPPAPVRFSTITGWPRCSDILAATMRPTVSTAPPAANGTTIRIGRFGKFCARLEPAGTHAATATATNQQSRRTFDIELFLFRNLRELDGLGVALGVGLVLGGEFGGRVADRRLRGRQEPRPHLRIGQRLGDILLDALHDIGRRAGRGEQRHPASHLEALEA